MATGFFGSEGLFIDTAADRLYVPDRQISDSIRIWENISTLDGNVAPDRVLSGVLTGIDDPRGIFVHPVTDELFVANQNPQAVHVFMSASVVDGDVAPIRSLTGAATLLTAVPFGLTVDVTRD